MYLKGQLIPPVVKEAPPVIKKVPVVKGTPEVPPDPDESMLPFDELDEMSVILRHYILIHDTHDIPKLLNYNNHCHPFLQLHRRGCYWLQSHRNLAM